MSAHEDILVVNGMIYFYYFDIDGVSLISDILRIFPFLTFYAFGLSVCLYVCLSVCLSARAVTLVNILQMS